MSAVLDYAAGPMLGSSIGGGGITGGESVHSGPSHRSHRSRSGSRAASPSALSAKSGSTSCSTGRLSASEIKRVLDKLKAELDNERMKNKQFVKERAVELKKSKLWFEREKQAALEAMAHDLKRGKEKALRENDNEWRQAVKARDEEIRLLREDVRNASNPVREDTQGSSVSSNNEEFVLRLQKEIRTLRQANHDLEVKCKSVNHNSTVNERATDSVAPAGASNIDIKLLQTVRDLVQDLDAQVNSEAFFASGSVPELPETLGQMKEQLKVLASLPDQLSAAERERIRQMERALHRLRSENEDLKKQRAKEETANSNGDKASEEKIKKLKRRNAELVAIARRLEERLKAVQLQRRQAPAGAASEAAAAETVSEMRQEFERQRARDLAEHAKAMLERDKQLENMRRRLEATSASSNAATHEAMEAMLKTAQRERLQLEKQLTWYMHRENAGGGEAGSESAPSATAGASAGAEQLPILQEKLKIIAERLRTRDQENQSLSQHLETARGQIEELEKSQRSQSHITREIERLRRELHLAREVNEKLEKEAQAVSAEKTALTVQVSDLRTRVESFDKVNEEKQQMEASLADLRHALSEQQREQQAERTRMKAHMTEMEELVQHLREVAERRRSLESDREEMRRQLQAKEEQISALNLNKTELCRVHEETVESLRASLREMERRCELQTLQHEEAMLELEAMRKKQHYRQQQEEQQQQLRQQQLELEEEQAQRQKEQEEADKAAETKRNKELEAVEEASFVESLVASLKSAATAGHAGNGANALSGVVNGPAVKRRAPPVPVDPEAKGASQQQLPPPLRIFTAKYSYDPYHYSPNENPDAELSLKSGEYLIVHGSMDADGFFLGEQMDGKRGLVPSNFVEPVDMSELGPDFNLSAILGRPDGASNGSDDEKSLPASAALDKALLGRHSSTPVVGPPAPCHLRVERLLSNSVVVAWQPPPGPLSSPISAYHVYVDGQFRAAVRAVSKTRALLEGVDTRKPHRVSVRAVATSGQSKDAECTLVVGEGASPTPEQLKATQISAAGAKLSWVPGDSKFSHSVVVNGREVKSVPPGDYKLHLSRLIPDTLHRVRVIPRPNTVSNTAGVAPNQADAFAASLEFRTLPGGLAEAPIDVQVEEGPQERTLLVTWLPVTLEEGGESNGVKVEGYILVVNGERVREAPGATTDHHLLPVDCVLPILGDHPGPMALLTVRTRACDGSESLDSHPPVELSVLTLGRGRTNLQVLRRPGDVRSPAGLRHAGKVGKSPTEEVNSLESPPIPGGKGVAVPEIHIIGSEINQGADRGLADPQGRTLGHIEGPRVSDRRSHRRKHQPPPPPPPPDPKSERVMWARRPDVHNDEEAADRELEQVMAGSGPGPGHQPQPHARAPPLQAGVSPTEQLGQFPSGGWAASPPPMSLQQSLKSCRMFVALYDYDPNTMSPNQDAVTDELPFHEGQLIKIYGDRDEDGFYFGECNGRRGLVPYNMVTEVTEPDVGAGDDMMVPMEAEHPSQAVPGPTVMRLDGGAYQRSGHPNAPVDPGMLGGERVRRMVALYDYDPHELSPNVDADDMELPFCTGDVILVFGEMDDDGFFMGECLATGRQGLVPSNFLQELPSRSPSPLPPSGAPLGNPYPVTNTPPSLLPRHQPAGGLDPAAPSRAHPSSATPSHRDARRPKAAIRSPNPASAPGVAASAANAGAQPAVSSEPLLSHAMPPTSTTAHGKDEGITSSLVRSARPMKALARREGDSLSSSLNGSISPQHHTKGDTLDFVAVNDALARLDDAVSGGERHSGDLPVYSSVDLVSSHPYLKQQKRQLSQEEGEARSSLSMPPPRHHKPNSVTSSLSSRSSDVTPLSTPTPTKKASPRTNPPSQPGTPHTERKRTVFKNPFKKRKA